MSNNQPRHPGLVARATSRFVMTTVGVISRSFLFGLNRVEVVGKDRFQKVLDARKDIDKRKRGLVTACNHISVLDDPIVWGVLPFKYTNDHRHLRWSLGSHDICYTSNLVGKFFFSGQTLPTHRLKHSPWGGLFQPVMNEAVRLLSAKPLPASTKATASPASTDSLPLSQNSASSETQLAEATTGAQPPAFFTTNNVDRWEAPSSYVTNRHAWVHIFPEGMVHQKDDRSLRYFKWGVARLVLESEPAPDVVPMFIDGLDRVMHEERAFPRFVPRIGKKVRVVFGETVEPERFAGLRQRWHDLVARAKADKASGAKDTVDLRYGPEAQAIRSETATVVREEILKLRHASGFPDEDPSLALGSPKTWANEPNKKRYRSQVDDSMVYEE